MSPSHLFNPAGGEMAAMMCGMSEFLAPTFQELGWTDTFQKLGEMVLDLEDNHGVERAICPLVHRFTPGLYIREILMVAGTFVITAKHLTEHPFVISKGKVRVVEEGKEALILEAPHTGITQPGTQRVIYVLEDTIWTTFHATEETDVESIGNAILCLPDNPRLNQWRDDLPQYQKTIEP